ncbi:MAG: hypothetical protein ABW148_02860, partial [Sedimenticola sp.]
MPLDGSALDSPLAAFDIRFVYAIDNATFGAEDIVITGSQVPAIESITSLDGINYSVTLAGAIDTDGDYSIAIGPDILSSSNRGMDQDRDDIDGEVPDDVFTIDFSLDQVAPVVATVTSHTLSPAVHLLNRRQVTLTGEREDNTAIWINGVSKVPSGSGNWAVADFPLVEGSNSLSLEARDAAGNISTPVELLLNVDSVAPVITAITPVTGSYLNTPPASIDVSVVEAGSGIDVDASTLTLTRGTTTLPGSWQLTGSQLRFTPDIAFTEGVYQLRGSVKDLGGLASTEHTSLFVIDQTPP